jgi:hypothetical protein
LRDDLDRANVAIADLVASAKAMALAAHTLPTRTA